MRILGETVLICFEQFFEEQFEFFYGLAAM
jgi:hypothetical protein